MKTFYTAQMRYKFKHGKRDDENRLVIDTTVKNKSKLAPTWSMVSRVKGNIITWEEYTEEYMKLMRERYANYRWLFHSFLHVEEDVVLCCYCNGKENTNLSLSYRECHRYLLVDIFEKIATERLIIPFRYGGELK